MADDQLGQLRVLRTGGADQPVLATVTKAVQATLGVPAADVSPEARFIDLGGDSLSALTFSTLLADIYGFEIPVGVVIDPTGDLLTVADHIERHRAPGAARPTYASVHDTGSTEVHARRPGPEQVHRRRHPEIRSVVAATDGRGSHRLAHRCNR